MTKIAVAAIFLYLILIAYVCLEWADTAGEKWGTFAKAKKTKQCKRAKLKSKPIVA